MQAKFLDKLKILISKNTSNPPGNEYLIINPLTQLFKQSGLKVEIIQKSIKRPNIIGKIGEGKNTIGIFCHTDVVPAGENWETNPFDITLKHGNVYGRGVADDKGPLIIALLAIEKFVKRYNNKKDYSISLFAISDEEADNNYGINFLIKRGLKINKALVLDGGWLDKIDIGEKGCIQLKIFSYGKQEHSGLQERGINAIENLTKMLNALLNAKWPTKFDNRFSPIKVNISKIKGGDIPNVIPSRAYAQMDIRYPLGINVEDVLTKIRKIINKLGKTSKVKFKIKVIYTTKPHICKDKKLINSLIQAGKCLGINMKPITIAGNSLSKEIALSGIPSINHIPFSIYTPHEPNEHIKLREAILGIDIYYNFLINYFFKNK